MIYILRKLSSYSSFATRESETTTLVIDERFPHDVRPQHLNVMKTQYVDGDVPAVLPDTFHLASIATN
jgi:hypothetical protein